MKQKINKELLLLLPDEVKAMNLPPKAQEIYCQFLALADEDGWCYSTINGLAKELHCSTSSIIANIKLLENKNLILERVTGKRGTATTFKIKLHSNENENELHSNENVFDSNVSCNDSNAFDSKLSIEEVILLKFKELDDLITQYFKSKKTSEKIDDSQVKQNKTKQNKLKQINNISNNNSSYNIQEVIDIDKKKDINKKNILIDIKENIDKNKKENIEIDMNKDIDKSTCKYKRRKKNDYEFTLEEKDDYNPIVEETKVVGLVSKSDGNTSKTKKFFYSLKDSSIVFNSWTEAIEYSMKNNLNFDENFNKVEVLV